MNFFEHYYQEKTLAYLPASSEEKQVLPEPLVEIFIDPSKYELEQLYKDSPERGVRIGVDSLGRVFAWNENILHDNMQKKLDRYDGDNKGVKGIQFVLKLINTKGDKRLFLSSDNNDITTEAELLARLPKMKVARLKLFFPDAKSINNNETHDSVFTFK
jgi:hypothetical protein